MKSEKEIKNKLSLIQKKLSNSLKKKDYTGSHIYQRYIEALIWVLENERRRK